MHRTSSIILNQTKGLLREVLAAIASSIIKICPNNLTFHLDCEKSYLQNQENKLIAEKKIAALDSKKLTTN